MNKRLFKGIRTKNGAFVTYEDIPLDLRLDLKEHSPMGFEWGYNGSGPKQLALAILSKVSGDEFALFAYNNFSSEFIETIHKDEWKLDYHDIYKWTSLYGFSNLKPVMTPDFKIVEANQKYTLYFNGKVLGSNLNIDGKNNMEFNERSMTHTVYTSFDELSHLRVNQLPELISFSTNGPYGDGYEDCQINDRFAWYGFERKNNLLVILFNLVLPISEYDGYINSKILIDTFLNQLIKKFIKVDVDINTLDDGVHDCYFMVSINDDTNNLSNIVEKVIEEVLAVYDNTLHNFDIKNRFEATFNLPEEYQSILKPYMLYFEEFLHDLCIDSDVNIRKEGEDTILSVEPKDKDEALEKIANALKMYLSAPIVASNVNLEQKLQMQVALQKLHAECSHMESQLLLKTAMLNTHQQQLVVHDEIIGETKRILVEAGVKPEIITQNNTILLDSLKEIRFDNRNIKKKTFFESFKGKLKVADLFDASIEVNMKQLENKEKDNK